MEVKKPEQTTLDLKGLLGIETGERAEQTLNRLFGYIDRPQCALVGGLSFRHHLRIRRAEPVSYDLEFNDLDFAIKTLDAIHPAIGKPGSGLLVFHYHPQDQYIAVLDHRTKVHTDFFGWPHLPYEVESVLVAGKVLQMPTAPNQLVATADYVMRRLGVIHEGTKGSVDPKHTARLKALWRTLSEPEKEAAQATWLKRRPDMAFNLEGALRAIDLQARQERELIQRHPFRHTEPYVCDECDTTGPYTIVPMKEVFAIMRKD